MTAGLPRHVTWHPSTISIDGGSHSFRSMPRPPTGTAFLRPRRSDAVEKVLFFPFTKARVELQSWRMDASIGVSVTVCQQKFLRPDRSGHRRVSERRTCLRSPVLPDRRTDQS